LDFIGLLSLAFSGELQILHSKLVPLPEVPTRDTKPVTGIPNATPFPGIETNVFKQDHGISDIGIERSRCLAGCPAYTLIIRADGSFRYIGEYGVERLGEYTGIVNQGILNQVLAFINEARFFGFEDSYTASFLDGPTTYTMVVKQGKTKVIENYANSGPATLWAIEQLIDSLLENAEWHEGGGQR
jgi:hypothetical protein